uniref:Uncharacterized protein n=2 Tax=Timema TaxID=61471 RepID=A0A7R9D8M9_TIMPO|nr:unnamed protein product [Timema poppensis]
MFHVSLAVHDGDYWRLLTPGKYVITAYRDDYRPKSVRVTVVNQPHQEAPRVDFDLTPVVSRFEEEGNPDYDQPYDDILQDKMVTDLRKKWAYHSLGPKRRYLKEGTAKKLCFSHPLDEFLKNET